MRQKRRAPCSHIEGFVGPALDREQTQQSDVSSAKRRVAVEVSGHTKRKGWAAIGGGGAFRVEIFGLRQYPSFPRCSPAVP